MNVIFPGSKTFAEGVLLQNGSVILFHLGAGLLPLGFRQMARVVHSVVHNYSSVNCLLFYMAFQFKG